RHGRTGRAASCCRPGAPSATPGAYLHEAEQAQHDENDDDDEQRVDPAAAAKPAGIGGDDAAACAVPAATAEVAEHPEQQQDDDDQLEQAHSNLSFGARPGPAKPGP